MKIGFLGCGKIAEPMIRSLCRQFPQCEIFVSQRSRSVAGRLNDEFSCVSLGDNQWVVDQSEIIFLTILADVARNILPDLRFKANHKVISAMSDIDLAEIGEMINPAMNPCVTIPIPFIETGNCPLAVFPDSPELAKLFGNENILITLNGEDAMGPHFAATALLSTVMAELECVSRWLGNKSGQMENAEIYIASLLSGYLGAMEKDGKQRFLEAMQELSTEGGLNTQLLNHNRDAGMLDVLEEGLQKLDERLNSNQK